MGMRCGEVSFEISGTLATNQAILTALKQYGMIMADNGSYMYISGAPDDRVGQRRLAQPGKDHRVGFRSGADEPDLHELIAYWRGAWRSPVSRPVRTTDPWHVRDAVMERHRRFVFHAFRRKSARSAARAWWLRRRSRLPIRCATNEFGRTTHLTV